MAGLANAEAEFTHHSCQTGATLHRIGINAPLPMHSLVAYICEI
jgi:hypothetical protein